MRLYRGKKRTEAPPADLVGIHPLNTALALADSERKEASMGGATYPGPLTRRCLFAVRARLFLPFAVFLGFSGSAAAAPPPLRDVPRPSFRHDVVAALSKAG